MSARKNIPFKRKREGKTNYKKRLTLLKSGKPRLVVRKSNTQMILQIVKYSEDGDQIIASVSSSALKKQGWNHSFKNLPACYLAGLMLAKKANQKGVKQAVLDTGLLTVLKGSRIYAAAKGVAEGGLEISQSEEIYPTEERIKGEHITSFNKKASSITKDYEELKKKING
jgi:large subunit ribosomal protein L18